MRSATSPVISHQSDPRFHPRRPTLWNRTAAPRQRGQRESLALRSCPADEILNRTGTMSGTESDTRVGQMDLAFLLPARFLCSARRAASRYEVRLVCDKVQQRVLGGHLGPATAFPMNTQLKAYGFAPLAVLVSALVMAWTSGLAWHHLGGLRRDFSMVQSESFHLAEHVEEKLLALNGTLRRLGVPPDPAVMADFQRQASEMKLWVQTNRLSVTSAQQRDSLNRIEAALDVYVVRTTRIVDENMRVGSSAKSKPVLESTAQETSQLLGQGRELRVAEQAALDRLVKESRRSMANLYIHVVAAVGVALVLGLATLRLIYVARIAPLR